MDMIFIEIFGDKMVKNLKIDNKSLIQKQEIDNVSEFEISLEEKSTLFDDYATNDFDIEREKYAVMSTYQTELKELYDTIYNIEPCGHQVFDKLKIAIDLKKYNRIINFKFLENDYWEECSTPEKHSTLKDESIKRKNLITHAIENYEEQIEIFNNKINEDDFTLDIFDGFDDFVESDEEVIEEERKRTSDNEYPNCRISYELRKRKLGLQNIYIKNDNLYIYITGKYTAKRGYLGGIHKENILDVLQEILDLNLFSFDIEKFYQNACVYLCDVCADIKVYNAGKYIKALSSFLPLASDKAVIRKYRNESIMYHSKAKNYGSSFIAYDKYAEIMSRHKCPYYRSYYETIEDCNLFRDVIRFECKMFKLNDMRKLLNIPKKVNGIVLLKDVMESKATPILDRLAFFGVSISNIEKQYKYFVKDSPFKVFFDIISSPEYINAAANFINKSSGIGLDEKYIIIRRLAEQRVAQLLKENRFDLTIIKDTLAIENDDISSEIFKAYNTTLKSTYLDFITYQKPKTLRAVTDLLKNLRTYYKNFLEETSSCDK